MRAALRTLARPIALATIGVALASPALAQVYKCVDASGATTYQQTPCPTSAKGQRLELSIDNGGTRDTPEVEAGWEAAAQQKNVSAGMPRRYVRLALGAPRDVRPGRESESASEVWSYARADGSMQRIGFRNGAVVWMRDDVAAADGGPAPDDEMTQRMLRRRNVVEGQDCAAVSASLGPPDSSDAGGGMTAPGPPVDPAAIVRYTWEPGPGDPNTRTTITCAGGRVQMIERAGVR